jgi:ribosomal-protein-alanine N-acetyltransferase
MSDSALRIRRMSDADLECVLKIAESLREAPHWTAAAYATAMDDEKVPRRVALVAELDSGPCADVPGRGALVGFVVAVVVADEAELETIAVVEAEQRRGVGRKLLRALVEELRTQRVGDLNLEVRASNERAIRFYCAEGFAEAGRRKRYYTDPEEDAILMKLSLA